MLFRTLAILFLLILCFGSVATAIGEVPWNTPGYLVIGNCYTNLADASREYDQRKAEGFPYIHIRNTRNWATSLQSGYYALVYNTFPTAEQAESYANEVRGCEINVYVKHSGRPVGEAGGKTGYYIIGLCSKDMNLVSREAHKYYGTKYVDVTWWNTNEFVEFSPGYFCVVFGVYKNLQDATAYADYVKSNGIDVYVKYGSWKG